MIKSRSKVLLISSILSLVYVIYMLVYFTGANQNTTSDEEMFGAAIATALILPHLIMFIIGTVFGWLGLLGKFSWAALVASILYSVGTLFFPAYFMFGVPILVLGFIGYANQKKLNTVYKKQ